MHRHTPDRCALRLREIRAVARRQGGRCLSNEYVTQMTRMMFECGEGHRWETTAVVVLKGSWCPQCRYRPPDTVARLKAIARERGGRCLSDVYVPTPPGMRWRCASGHEWNATPAHVRRGTWCPQCVYNERRTLADMQVLAARHGGTCIAREYLGHDTSIRWACAQGHCFAIRPRCVRQGQWCPVCNKGETTWSRALAFAQARDGACLSRGRPDAHSSVRWRCSAGHQWTSNAYRVAGGTWCPRCAGRRLGIEDMQSDAAKQFGRCLSKEYAGIDTKLQWECEKGHRWWTRPENVRHRGTWCPECACAQRAEQRRSDARDRR